MLKRMKKGFTLAELLIVVAIIAVLTAIAVPIFVTTLGSAQNAADEANLRVVRTAGITHIIGLKKGDDEYDCVYDNKGNMYKYIVVTADIDAKGIIDNLKLEKYEESYHKTLVDKITDGHAIALITSLDYHEATGG